MFLVLDLCKGIGFYNLFLLDGKLIFVLKLVVFRSNMVLVWNRCLIFLFIIYFVLEDMFFNFMFFFDLKIFLFWSLWL